MRTPDPLDAQRLLLNQMATERVDCKGAALEVRSVDLRNASFNAVPKRSLFVHFPKEMGLEKGVVASLKRCVYGTRDAGQLWDDCYAPLWVDMGFRRGLASPVCVCHQERHIRFVVHGDDFTALATAPTRRVRG